MGLIEGMIGPKTQHVSFANTANCNAEMVGSTAKYGVRTAVYSAGAVGIVAVARKNPEIAKKIADNVDKLVNVFKKSGFGNMMIEGTKKIIAKAKANPALAKTVAAVGVPLLILTAILQGKSDVANGRIIEKYNNIDRLQKEDK